MGPARVGGIWELEHEHEALQGPVGGIDWLQEEGGLQGREGVEGGLGRARGLEVGEEGLCDEGGRGLGADQVDGHIEGGGGGARGAVVAGGARGAAGPRVAWLAGAGGGELVVGGGGGGALTWAGKAEPLVGAPGILGAKDAGSLGDGVELACLLAKAVVDGSALRQEGGGGRA